MSRISNGYRIFHGFMPYTETEANYTENFVPLVNTLKKRGKTVLFSFMSGPLSINADKPAIITIPKGYRPVKSAYVMVYMVIDGLGGVCNEVELTKDGILEIDAAIALYCTQFRIQNAGWEIE